MIGSPPNDTVVFAELGMPGPLNTAMSAPEKCGRINGICATIPERWALATGVRLFESLLDNLMVAIDMSNSFQPRQALPSLFRLYPSFGKSYALVNKISGKRESPIQVPQTQLACHRRVQRIVDRHRDACRQCTTDLT